MPRFSIEPADESFFDTAPHRLVETFDIQRPASAVWSDLTSDDALRYCRIIKSIEWTSPRPFGVGTTRTAHVLGGLGRLEERFFLWEEGRRKAFTGLSMNLPLFRRIAEDYVVEPTDDASCRFTWTVAFEPAPVPPGGGPINRRLLGTLFTDVRKHYGLG